MSESIGLELAKEHAENNRLRAQLASARVVVADLLPYARGRARRAEIEADFMADMGDVGRDYNEEREIQKEATEIADLATRWLEENPE